MSGISKKCEAKIAVALYVFGKDFDSSAATAVSGLSPSLARNRGQDWMTSSNRKVIAKEGAWSVRLQQDGGSIDEVLRELLMNLGSSAQGVVRLAGVDDAYFDIFVAYEKSASDETDEILFELSSDTLSRIASVGIPLKITAAVVRK